MTDINSVVLVGNLTRDIEVRYSNSGVAIGRVSIAINRSRKNGDQWVDEVSYFDVVIFGKTAENLRPYLTRGQKIAVQGSLVQSRWEKDGQKNSRVEIQADNVQLCGSRGGNNNSSGNYQQNRPQNNSGYNNNQQQNYGQNQGFGGNSNVYQSNDNSSSFPEDIPYADDGMDIPF